MKNNLIRFLLTGVFAAFFLMQASGQEIKQKSKENAGGGEAAIFYRITGKDLKKPSYLFGTVHVVCETDMLPMDKLNGYLDETERLVLEVDMDNAAEMQAMQKGLYIPGGKTFTDYLKPEQKAMVDEMVKSTLGTSVEEVKSFRPVILQVMMMTSPKVIGCNPPSSYELTLLQTAARKKKPVEGLETVASQLEALDTQPLEKQARQLYEAALDPEKNFRDFRQLLTTYKSQNSDALYDLINRQMGAEDKDFQTRLLDTRNTAWIPGIEKMIAEKPSFIAVGGGHLGGKKGVINLLKARGYTVEAIKL